MSFLVELMFPKWTYIAVSLILFFTIDVLKQMKVQFFFFYSKFRRVSLEICLITPHYLPVVFDLVRTVTFEIFRFICIICKSHMFLFPIILVL